MRLPVQAGPVVRGRRLGRTRAVVRGGVEPHCSIGDQFKCAGEAVGVGAACATVETGIGAAACLAAAVGFVSDCRDCAAAQPLKDTICLAATVAEKLHISVPSVIQSWCN